MAKRKKAAKVLTPEEKLQQALVPVEEQPYEVPGNWCWVPQQVICKLSNGEKMDGPEYPYLEVKYLRGNKEAKMVHSGKYIPAYSKVILVDGENSGEVFTVSENGYMGSTFKALEISKTVLPDYLLYFIATKKDLYRNNKKGSAIPHLNKDMFFSIAFPLAPLAEQQRIVDRIESIFAKLDEAKEKAQAVADGFELRKSAILHKAFTGELTAKWREEHGVGLDSWETEKLENCGKWYGGGTPSKSHPEYWDDGDLMWITSKDMKADLIEDTLMHTNMLGVNNSSANYIENPSVLFVMRSGILRRTLPIAVVKQPFTINQDLKAVTPKDTLHLEYLFWVCKNSEREMLETCMKNGTTVESINASALMNFEIPIADMGEQLEIVKIIESLLDKEQQVRESTEAVIDQIDIMKKSVLARAFRGELGTNDPAEESAVELLKSIL